MYILSTKRKEEDGYALTTTSDDNLITSLAKLSLLAHTRQFLQWVLSTYRRHWTTMTLHCNAKEIIGRNISCQHIKGNILTLSFTCRNRKLDTFALEHLLYKKHYVLPLLLELRKVERIWTRFIYSQKLNNIN